MKYFIFFLLNLFNLFNLTKNELLLIKYGLNTHVNLNYNEPQLLLNINNIKYRDTTTFSETFFPIKINKYNYNYNIKLNNNKNNDNLEIEQINNYNNFKYSSGLVNKLLHNTIILEKLFFNIEKDNTKIHLICKLSAFSFKNKNKLFLTLYLNNKILIKNIYNNTFTFTYNKILILNKGQYYLYFKTYSDDLWCSCPENKNGFIMSRFLSKWEYSNNTQNKNLIKYNNEYIFNQLSLIFFHLKFNNNLIYYMSTSRL